MPPRSPVAPEALLTARAGLPEPLRALLEVYPRNGWTQDRNFDGLVAFWLDRHLTFRRLLETLRKDAETRIAGDMDAVQHGRRLQRNGSLLVSQLHGHHQIEDMQYFPQLARLEPGLEHGFALLDADHGALDGILAGFTDSANAVLRGAPAGAFRDELVRFEALLDRHLQDEEDLIVPVILKHGAGGLT